MKKPNYADMFTLRSDGRYQGYWHELDRDGNPKGKRHAICDRDPERLYRRILEKEREVPPVPTFKFASDAWSEKHWQRVGAKTAETYKAPLRRLQENFAGEKLEEVSAQEIQAFLAELGKQGFSRRSVQMHRDILNMVFNDAIVSGLLSFNPCTAVSMPRNLPVKKRELPEDAARAAEKAAAQEPPKRKRGRPRKNKTE